MGETDLAVLMVVESLFPALQGGGAESQVRTLGLEFLRRGLPVTVLAPLIDGGPPGTHDEVDGIPVRRLAYPRVRWIGAAWMLAAMVAWLVRERRRYDVIHAHIAGNMAAVCSLVGRVLGKPVVVKLTGMHEMRHGVLSPDPGPVVRVRAAALRHASAFHAISARIADALEARGHARSKVRRIPNAVDVARFASLAPDAALRRGLCGDASVVGVYVGRLEDEKGLEHLVDGWARALRGRGDAALVVVGDGSLRGALEARGARLGIGEAVRFVGATERVERYLAIADFGVLTSLHEGLSNTLLEYMAAGLPVLGTRVSGTEDFVVDGRTGWLVAPSDPAAIADALQAIVAAGGDRLRELGTAARALVTERASIGAVVDQLIRTYVEAGARLRPATARRRAA